MTLSIYIVADDERRAIIVAPSATRAGQIAIEAGLVGGGSTDATVGRLGAYEPGIEGAALSPMSIVGTWDTSIDHPAAVSKASRPKCVNCDRRIDDEYIDSSSGAYHIVCP